MCQKGNQTILPIFVEKYHGFLQIWPVMLKKLFAKTNQPRLQLPINEKEKFTALAGWLLLTGMFVYTAVSYGSLPESVPTHFGPAGTPDDFGGKGSIWALPLVSFVLTLLMTVLMRYPHTFSYMITITDQNAEYQYRLARMLLLSLAIYINLLFFMLQHSTIQVATGASKGLDMYSMLFAMAGNLVILIVYLVKSGKH